MQQQNSVKLEITYIIKTNTANFKFRLCLRKALERYVEY